MIEVILVYFLARKNGYLAEQKGLNRRSWIWRTVLVWIASEFLGVIVGMAIWGNNNFLMIELAGIGFAVGGYFTVREALLRKDDYTPTDFDFEKDQDNINNS